MASFYVHETQEINQRGNWCHDSFSPNINNNVNTNLKSRLRTYTWDVVAMVMGAWVQQGKYQFVDENTDNEIWSVFPKSNSSWSPCHDLNPESCVTATTIFPDRQHHYHPSVGHFIHAEELCLASRLKTKLLVYLISNTWLYVPKISDLHMNIISVK